MENEIRSALTRCEDGPVREDIANEDYNLLTRSIIVYRYLLNNFFERG